MENENNMMIVHSGEPRTETEQLMDEIEVLKNKNYNLLCENGYLKRMNKKLTAEIHELEQRIKE